MAKINVKSGLNQAIRDNIALGKNRRPWTELAKEFGVKVETVYRRVAEQNKRLFALKRLKKAAEIGQVPSTKPVLETDAKAPDLAELLLQAENSPILTRDQRLRTLSHLAQKAPDAVRVAAVAKLEEMERAAGSQFGPPPPTTRQDMVKYLCELFDGLELDIIIEAIENVFGATEDPETAETAQNSPADPSSGDLGGREVRD